MYVNPFHVNALKLAKGIQGLLRGLEWIETQLVVNLHATKAPATSPSGRLQLLLCNWKQITQDPWILENVQGHKLELTATPLQEVVPEELHPSRELESCMVDELSKLIQKGAITAVAPPYPVDSFVSRMFLVPKKDSSYRPIIDL